MSDGAAKSLIRRRNIGGTTLHGWAGIGLGKLPAATLASVIEAWEPAAYRWRETDALLTDESKLQYNCPLGFWYVLMLTLISIDDRRAPFNQARLHWEEASRRSPTVWRPAGQLFGTGAGKLTAHGLADHTVMRLFSTGPHLR